MDQTFYSRLANAWSSSNSMVCVGLDTDARKLPKHLEVQEPSPAKRSAQVFEFNREIIDHTAEYACCFKIQFAFYAAYGLEETLAETIQYLRNRHPSKIIILDAKRGDIGNTCEMYAIEAFERFQADAVTVNPYMGTDSVEPFARYKDRGTIVLCKTSNAGSEDLQGYGPTQRPLYQHVAKLSAEKWNTNSNLGLVVGATYPDELKITRSIVGPDFPLLIPGLGAQGGDLEACVKAGISSAGFGMMINSSRGIIYKSLDQDFAEVAGREAKQLRDQINLAAIAK